MTKYLLITAFIISLLASCVEPFDIKTNNSPPLIVVYGHLTNEFAYHEIQISASSPYFDTKLNQSISGADVQIISSENEVFYFKETIPGRYFTIDKVAGSPGATYSLNVEVDFDNDGIKETYSASSTMLSAVKVDSVELKHIKLMGYQFYSLNFYAQDPPSEDYYLGRYKINDSSVLTNINQLSSIRDITFNGRYINGQAIQRFRDINDKDIIEKENDDTDNNIYIGVGDTIAFSLCHIEKGYYDFIHQCQKEISGENPFFGGPASNIATNISNGGLGYFTTYAVSTVETVLN
jgi:dimeric dUTPase (all-alpha-NTP-PPase superfamily)